MVVPFVCLLHIPWKVKKVEVRNISIILRVSKSTNLEISSRNLGKSILVNNEKTSNITMMSYSSR
jgi:hypothetical protein